MKDDDVLEWITINHQHVPIKKGENKREVARNFIKNKMSRVEKNKNKYNTIDNFKKRKETNKFKFNKEGNRYELNSKERAKVFKEMGLKDLEKNEISKENTDTNRRAKLMKFTQENKEQIKEWADKYDEEANKKAFEKASRGEGLKKEEYFGFIGSKERPGDIISDVTYDGEDVIVAKDGKWVRKSRIKEYNENPSANKDAIVDLEEEERKFNRETINNYRRRKK